MRGVVLLCLLLVACGDDDEKDDPAASGLVSCTTSFDGLDFPQGCFEMSESAASQLQQGCQSQTLSGPDGGTFTLRLEFAAGPCSRVNARGGCRRTETGMAVTTWTYDGGADSGIRETSEELRRSCEQKGGLFVLP